MAEPAAVYPWHQPVWHALTAQENQPHALLFSGRAGVGKRQFADAFADWLLCLQGEEGGACGQCRSCQLRLAGNHPDRLVVEPAEEGKVIPIAAVRELTDFMMQTAQQGGRKVVVLHPAEALNLSSSNALLKSLEEPPAETYLLLVTDQPSRLLPTIRSRCQIKNLPVPTLSDATTWLAEQLPELAAVQHQALLQMAGGAPLRALALHGMKAAALREQVVEGVKALLKNQTSASQLAESWTAVPLELMVDWFCDWTLDLLRLKTAAIEVPLNSDMDKVLPYMARHLTMPRLMEWQNWLLQHRGMILSKANLNRPLLIETLLMQWKQLMEKR